MIHLADVPVYLDADWPLRQTYAFHERWQARYTRYYWNGMWNDKRVDARAHPTEPWKVIPLVNGAPHSKPQQEQAVDFIIRTVRANPGRARSIAVARSRPLPGLKLYGPTITAPGRYSPAECIGAKKVRVTGSPEIQAVSTSYVERQNLT